MNRKKGKIIILSAPSGTGKSSIIEQLMNKGLGLEFSISATSRQPRGEEQNGREYYFLSPEEFAYRVKKGDFVEWEEVYAGTCYGTLASEVERVIENGNNLIMDIDVKGALNVKRHYGDKALSIFILPPSKEELERRLRSRQTDSEEAIAKRLAKADYELDFAPQFDIRIVNDNLGTAVNETVDAISGFVVKE